VTVAAFAAELVQRHDRRFVPVAAVGEYRGHADVEDPECAEADFGTFSPASDEPLEPVEQ
jgi:hypothetical protein